MTLGAKTELSKMRPLLVLAEAVGRRVRVLALRSEFFSDDGDDKGDLTSARPFVKRSGIGLSTYDDQWPAPSALALR